MVSSMQFKLNAVFTLVSFLLKTLIKATHDRQHFHKETLQMRTTVIEMHLFIDNSIKQASIFYT
jgi:hypothetical protein